MEADEEEDKIVDDAEEIDIDEIIDLQNGIMMALKRKNEEIPAKQENIEILEHHLIFTDIVDGDDGDKAADDGDKAADNGISEMDIGDDDDDDNDNNDDEEAQSE